MRCVNCQFENPEGMNFCGKCATPLTPPRCRQCGFDNPSEFAFCGKCGAVLTAEPEAKPSKRRQTKAAGTNRRKAQSQDGRATGSQRRASAEPTAVTSGQTLDSQPRDARRTEGERRQLTVMFCDLVGSTALSAELDPEEYQAVVQAYQATCTTIIEKYAGRIAQHLGDGILAYFGYPTAHEDDAARAARASLEMLIAIQQLVLSPFQGEGGTSSASAGEGNRRTPFSTPPHPHLLPQGEKELLSPLSAGARAVAEMLAAKKKELQIRIGIHTGLVVVGEIGGGEKREILALGETPNLAARLQGIADPNTIVLSTVTQRLIAGLFDCQPLEPQALKGISTSLTLYRVLGESTAQHRLDVIQPSGLTPLVGREEELALLQRRWEQVKDREGQVVLLSGEPGIGKSRLVRELRQRVGHDGGLRLEFRCSPYYQNSAWQPVIENLQRLLRWQKEDTPQTKLAKLQTTLTCYHFPQADTLALFAALLSLPHPADIPSLNMSPQRQKQKTEEVLIAWLVEESERAPLYCTWEDLHWADPSTLELLGRLIEQTPTTRLFVLFTSRPEFIPPWGQHGHLSQLTLSRLGKRQAPQMIVRVAGNKPLPEEVVQQIVAKTDGVPLFVEELTKMVLESGLLTEKDDHYELPGPLPPLAIPSTLQDSLMARLDRLATTKELAQLGATIGREFSYDLLQTVSPLDEQALQQGLQQLVDAELVYQRGTPPHVTYLFKHALIQDTAYQSLLKSRRQQLHQQIAQVLEEQFPDTKNTQPELLAHHYTEAGLITQAIPYWQQAGQQAIQRSANVEAIHHLTRGLDVLQTSPDTPDRTQQELLLLIALGIPLQATKGWGASEVEKAYSRARELCQQQEDAPQLPLVLFALSVFYGLQADYKIALELGEQLLSLAQRRQDLNVLIQAHHLLGSMMLPLGEFASAQEHFEQVITHYDPQQHGALAFQYGGYDPGMFCRSEAALALWLCGYPDQALSRSREALALAQELPQPFTLAFAVTWAAMLRQLRGEHQQTLEGAQATISLSKEQTFPYFLGWGTILQGWARTNREEGKAATDQIHQGVALYRSTGSEMWLPYILAMQAETCGKANQPEEGLATIAEALSLVETNGERLYEAELYRLKGGLTLQQERQWATGNGQQEKVTDARSLMPDAQCEAEGCFLKAIEIAQKQQAKSLELRAVMSLARLWRQRGKTAEARQQLAEIYDWFTEGFDTKDLQEAKALLEELSH